MTTVTSRHLPLAGSFNVRDLGGYTTADGRETRWRRLLRADGLHSLTQEAQAQLVAEGVTTVIDLRHDDEIQREPNVFAESSSVRYLHMPLFPKEASNGTTQSMPPTLGEMYVRALERSSAQIKAVFEVIADAADEAVLFHCTAGKDRTGIVAALALGTVNVPAPTIIEDYALTDRYLAPLLQTWRDRAAESGRDLVAFERYLYAQPENMQAMLTEIETRFGNAERYLRSIGLTDEKLERVRERLVG